MVWMDNYSKQWRTRIVGLSADAMKRCLWTCVAYKRFSYVVSMDHKMTRRGAVIPAMPTDPFLALADLSSCMKLMTQGPDGEMPLLFDESLMTEWGANQLPLAGDLDRIPEPYRSSIAAANDRSDDLYPRGLERENIGSNDGLARILRRFYEDRGMGTIGCSKYSALTVDVNIFDRMMKVKISKSISHVTLQPQFLVVLRCVRGRQDAPTKCKHMVGSVAQLQARR